jgi:hypothetical protein
MGMELQGRSAVALMGSNAGEMNHWERRKEKEKDR